MLKRERLDDILKGFNKLLTRLERLRERNLARMSEAQAEMAILEAEVKELQAESRRAAVVENNLSTLLAQDCTAR